MKKLLFFVFLTLRKYRVNRAKKTGATSGGGGDGDAGYGMKSRSSIDDMECVQKLSDDPDVNSYPTLVLSAVCVCVCPCVCVDLSAWCLSYLCACISVFFVYVCVCPCACVFVCLCTSVCLRLRMCVCLSAVFLLFCLFVGLFLATVQSVL